MGCGGSKEKKNEPVESDDDDGPKREPAAEEAESDAGDDAAPTHDVLSSDTEEDDEDGCHNEHIKTRDFRFTSNSGGKKSWAEIAAANKKDKPAKDPTKDAVECKKARGKTRPKGAPKAPFYPALPSGAEKHAVRNVYDGDTLTLKDERRVRFLGVDTPEVKEKQAFAQEAKSYTKDRCHKKDIWLSFEEGQKEDHYGRLLAHVWVPVDASGDVVNSESDAVMWECVNEGLVSAGFASAYAPGGANAEPPSNMKTLMKLQRKAREDRAGKWSDFTDFDVVRTSRGSAYHLRSCENIAKIRRLVELTASKAADSGLNPCRTCLADA